MIQDSGTSCDRPRARRSPARGAPRDTARAFPLPLSWNGCSTGGVGELSLRTTTGGATPYNRAVALNPDLRTLDFSLPTGVEPGGES